MKLIGWVESLIILCLLGVSCDQSKNNWYDQLKIDYTGDAKIEVGGPFAGVEFHHSACLPQRISFYYPVANSIDVSTDYWRRDTTFIMAAGLKFSDEKKVWLGNEPLTFSLTPYRVEFTKEDSAKKIRIRYQFAKTKPVLIVSFSISNKTARMQPVEFETHLETSLRTSHSFNRKKRAWTDFDPISATVFTYNADAETGNTVIFVTNGAEKPAAYHTRGPLQEWPFILNGGWPDDQVLIPRDKPAETATRFYYRKELNPGDSLNIVQIIGSARPDDCMKIAGEIGQQYIQEIDAYEKAVLKKAFADMPVDAGDPYLNHAVHWARAIMSTNEHYLDNQFVPMPCPAEYNFYFTHDVLVSDLAAVNFDLERVKRDLTYIVAHASPDSIIPHAYYWKDSSFVTEWANSDNWNNFWMIITSASYLRHAADSSFVGTLYPYLKKCLEIALRNKGNDNLMWTYRPDWWDIGKNYAPRSYMTILAIKAIREFIYISTILDKSDKKLLSLSLLADNMQDTLVERLWKDDFQYLMNYYEDNTIDPHYYIGSLLAVHYGQLDKEKRTALIKSAKNNMLDQEVGVYNAFPMDFAGLIGYLKFAGNEAGSPYYYFNGGIWPQGNAWYALALITNGEWPEAAEFIKKTMTVKGLMDGPNGQPAMYEVRNANRENAAEYGTVDKPQFMWAGAWYLYTLYHLLGLSEDEWNLALKIPDYGSLINTYYHTYAHGQKIEIKMTGKGSVTEKVTYDNKLFPSLIIPSNMAPTKLIRLYRGSKPSYPYLKTTKAALISVSFDEKTAKMDLVLKAMPGYKNETEIVIHTDVKGVSCDGLTLSNSWEISKDETIPVLRIRTRHDINIQHLSVFFR